MTFFGGGGDIWLSPPSGSYFPISEVALCYPNGTAKDHRKRMFALVVWVSPRMAHALFTKQWCLLQAKQKSFQSQKLGGEELDTQRRCRCNLHESHLFLLMGGGVGSWSLLRLSRRVQCLPWVSPAFSPAVNIN